MPIKGFESIKEQQDKERIKEIYGKERPIYLFGETIFKKTLKDKEIILYLDDENGIEFEVKWGSIRQNLNKPRFIKNKTNRNESVNKAESFTREDIEFIKDNFSLLGSRGCSKILNKRRRSIEYQGRKYKLFYKPFRYPDGHSKCYECHAVLQFNLFCHSKRVSETQMGECLECNKVYRKKMRKIKNSEKESRIHSTILELLKGARSRSRKKNFENEMDYKFLKKLISNNECPVFNKRFVFRGETDRKSPNRMSPSLDRVDNSKGYTMENVRVISYKANNLKSNATIEQIESLIYYIKNYKEFNNKNDHLKDYFKKKFGDLKYAAKKRNLDVNITTQDLLEYSPLFCPVMKEPFYIGKGINRLTPSIDRVDSSKGYIKGNIGIISHSANRIKSNGTLKQFEQILKYMKENTFQLKSNYFLEINKDSDSIFPTDE